MSWFDAFTRAVERAAGSPWAFLLAIATIVVWVVFGPLFQWSDTYQLVINTGTTIVTYLLVFVIQNTQSRDTAAIQLKLDELLLVTRQARNELINVETLDQATIDRLREDLARLAQR